MMRLESSSTADSDESRAGGRRWTRITTGCAGRICTHQSVVLLQSFHDLAYLLPTCVKADELNAFAPARGILTSSHGRTSLALWREATLHR